MGQHLFVWTAGGQFSDGLEFQARGSQKSDRGKGNVLIREKTHQRAPTDTA